MTFASKYLTEPLTDKEKEAYSKMKKEERERLYNLMLETARYIFTSPENYVAFLDFRSRFISYDLKNTILLYGQNKKVTDIRDFDEWTSAGAKIKKGEKGLTIFEKRNYFNQNKELVSGSFMKKVFDRSQTDIKSREKKEEYMSHERILSIYLDSCALTKEIIPRDENTNPVRFDIDEKTIFIQEKGGDIEFLIQSLFYEESKGHIFFQNKDMDKDELVFLSKSAAYVLSSLNDIDKKDFKIDHIPSSYGEKDGKDLIDSMYKGMKVAEKIYRNADREMVKRNDRAAMAKLCFAR